MLIVVWRNDIEILTVARSRIRLGDRIGRIRNPVAVVIAVDAVRDTVAINVGVILIKNAITIDIGTQLLS